MAKDDVVDSRITDGDPDSADAAKLVELVKKYGIVCPQYVTDLYAIFKFGGNNVLPYHDVMMKAKEIWMADPDASFWAIHSKLQERKLFLTNFTACPWFPIFQKLPPIEAVEKFLEMLKQCVDMANQARSAMGGNAAQFMQQGDEDADPNAPAAGQANLSGFQNILQWGMMILDMNTNPAMLGPAGAAKGEFPYYDVKFSPKPLLKSILEEAKRLSAEDLVVFELTRNFGDAMDSVGQTEKKVDSHVPETRDIGQGGVADIPRMLQGQNLDDDVADKKAVSNELIVHKNQETIKNRQLLHVLLDTSGSMQESAFGNVKKWQAASALILALLSKVVSRGDVFYFRFFAGGCGELLKAETDTEVKTVSDRVRKCDFNGGDTNIQTALMTAIEDITTSTIERLKKAEILIITDGEAEIDPSEVNKAKGTVKINSVLIGTNNSPMLERVSDRYCVTEMKNGCMALVDMGRNL